MDWGALGSRDAVLAICEHFRIDFVQARDHLLARQLQQAEERAQLRRKWKRTRRRRRRRRRRKTRSFRCRGRTL